MKQICENMTEQQARHNARNAVEAAGVSIALIADKSKSEYARRLAKKLAPILIQCQEDSLLEAFMEARENDEL